MGQQRPRPASGQQRASRLDCCSSRAIAPKMVVLKMDATRLLRAPGRKWTRHRARVRHSRASIGSPAEGQLRAEPRAWLQHSQVSTNLPAEGHLLAMHRAWLRRSLASAGSAPCRTREEVLRSEENWKTPAARPARGTSPPRRTGAASAPWTTEFAGSDRQRRSAKRLRATRTRTRWIGALKTQTLHTASGLEMMVWQWASPGAREVFPSESFGKRWRPARQRTRWPQGWMWMLYPCLHQAGRHRSKHNLV